MHSFSLDGRWALSVVPPVRAQSGNLTPATLLDAASIEIPATVPGDIALDLSRAGHLPDDLFRGKAITDVQDFEEYDFWYRTSFQVGEAAASGEDGAPVLVFEGVDCIARYFVNGVEAGQSRNALVPFELPVAGLLQPGQNELSVEIASPIREADTMPRTPREVTFASNLEGLHIRKPPHAYGWDIMPRAILGGIWRSVRLELRTVPRLDELYFYTESIGSDRATVGLWYALERGPSPHPDLTVRVQAHCGDSQFEAESQVFSATGALRVDVDSPRLWWPVGSGDPNLYDLEVSLYQGNRMVDSRELSVGIRTVRLVREPNPRLPRHRFQFQVNGADVFIRGTNWVPLDVFHSRDRDRYGRALELLAAGGSNMVRCWGGNVYEDEAFFDFCDRKGILVWQDIAMACGVYPQDDAFAAALRDEVCAVARRIRNHAGLALWCGDNECDTFSAKRGLDPRMNRLTRTVLPEALAQVDPYRDYLPSSPLVESQSITLEEMPHLPETHLWGPRAAFKAPFYAASTAAFVGEVGYHGAPAVQSIRQFIDQDYLWPWKDNEQWILHGTASERRDRRSSFRIDLMAKQIEAFFGRIPETLEEFVAMSQATQAEAVKYFVESSRIRRSDRSGLLWWNVLDGWPQFSDSLVDYYFRPKLAFTYVCRSQQATAVLASEPEGWGVPVYCVNDDFRPVALTVHIETRTFGVAADEGAESGAARESSERDAVYETVESSIASDAFETRSLTVDVPAGTLEPIATIEISPGRPELLLISWHGATSDGTEVSGRNHYLHASPPVSWRSYQAALPRITGEPSCGEGG